ncbi:hypothetical protein DKX38_015428 [Salix brachista]|uniref:Retrotransposon Copia-like N-terminal domain-containing protein n=1 Tax=Salix brachista TaxID=2182728 RepID=A0A5N5L559_9ROSI|nr:hypothetical protein DKX38_015428 [Salix brachista]
METENQQTPTSTMQSTTPFHNLSDHNNPYRLDNSDTSVLSLVTDLLTTENYVTWARAMKRVLRAKNKLGFVDGIFTRPTDPNDPLLSAWERMLLWTNEGFDRSLSAGLCDSVSHGFK